MKRIYSILALALLTFLPAFSKKTNPLSGRWDLTITTPDATYPSWMEFTEKGDTPEVRIVGRVSSVHPANNVKLSGDTLTFDTSEWFGKPIPVSWQMTVADQKITGKQTRSDGVEGQIAGVLAPALVRAKAPSWGDPTPLFDGKDLDGWTPFEGAANHWKAENGELVNEAAGANIRTTRKFDDFKLHIEFNCPKNGNSGVYLRGRYEVQVEYEPADENDRYHGLGAVYGFLPPSVQLPKKPGQWESFDITLVGRRVTVIRDGVKTIDSQEIPGITGGAIDSDEGAPGPIYIQGDHTGGMKYRNITIATAH